MNLTPTPIRKRRKMSNKTCYITTPIYYVNDVAHIGHAYTTIAADVLARFHRFNGEKVFFLTGTDEHGRKVEKAASEAGISPLELANRHVSRFQDLWQKLNISHDGFIRTTEDRHRAVVEELWKRVAARDDIYLGVYEDWYCVPCESYWPDKELVEGACPQCKRPVEKLKEESYFFRMSRYQEPLLRHIEENPEFIQPISRRNEIVAFVKEGLRDLSVSRTGFSWGIPVPGDSKHVIYVWFDALANYLTGAIEEAGRIFEDEKFLERWPADVHFIGKDILRFHAVYWPTFLLSAGLPLPRKIFAHGWWTVEGQKMSKSLGNVVDPNELVEKYGADPVRYFLLRDVPFGLDGDFSHSSMVARFNGDLANDLGNLLNRTLGMLYRYQKGRVEKPSHQDVPDRELEEASLKAVKEVETVMEEIAFSKALTAIWEIVSRTNKYIDEAAPWTHDKEGRKERVASIMYNCMEALRIITILVAPFMPDTARKMWAQLGIREALEEQGREDVETWGGMRPGITAGKPDPLFPRIDKKEDKVPAIASTAVKPLPQTGLVSIDEFKKTELRSARVLSAERVQGSQKLVKLIVDLGTEQRQIVAGIGRAYTPESLVGRNIVVIANLAPAKLMGVESRGMLLAGGGEDSLKIVTLDGDLPPGTLIK